MSYSRAPLVIRQEQLAVFEDLALEAFVDKLEAHLRRALPAQIEGLTTKQLRAAAKHGVKRAKKYGIERERDVSLFVDLLVMFGRNFDTERSWARKILEEDRGELTSSQLMAKLFGMGLSRAHKATPLGGKKS